ncbi:flagellar protein G [Methanolobus zinderi]|jgi:flagellar protein FlaG|uniref:Flagellar protein G n=1 Tax=Methanolobus zinderi TaxID=536044 RepID=A0A7D5I1M2_9EURY|nr:flagellar protein G [Methanolobus zinderi]QLC50646.1 flagellar protein G [Methanolobus zinderi]
MRDEHQDVRHSLFKAEKAETAVTHMIFFIAAIIIAMGVVTVLSADIQSMVASSSVSSKLLSDQMRTDITIVNDPYVIPYDSTGNYYTFYAKNTGKTELVPEFVTVMVDGVMIESANVDMDLPDGDVIWRPGDVLIINVITDPSPLNEGDHRILVAAENGKSGGMSFIT